MNIELLKFFMTDKRIPNALINHQIATLDYIIRTCYYDKRSVLLFHKMGSGKTRLALTLALLFSNDIKSLIIVPNNNIISWWKRELSVLIRVLSYLPINLNNIQINTRNKFIDELNSMNSTLINRAQTYKKHYIFIDEAHNFFGNNSGINIIKLKKNIPSAIFVLLTGSPISNTIEPLKDLLMILNENSSFEAKYINKGDKVYQTYLTDIGIKYMKEQFKGLVSYYNPLKHMVPRHIFLGTKLISYPVIYCPMSELQSKWYNNIRLHITDTEEMFSKNIMNVSFCALGELENYTSILNKKDKNLRLLPGLFYNGHIITGSELVNLNISSKFKYIVDKYINNITMTKKFLYFSNSNIGALIIKSIMRANGISEYKKDIVPNFRCVFCNMERTCETCKPVRFVIITSIEMSISPTISLIELIDRFNSKTNKNGEEIMFLFGSKIISEAYTLTEVKNIIFLTIPDTKTELSQIIARSLRSFSYDDIINTVVNIEILVSIDENNEYFKNNVANNKIYKSLTSITKIKDQQTIDKYVSDLNTKNIDYDLKKILYLEIKSDRSEIFLQILKGSHINYKDMYCKELKPIIYHERLKYYFFTNKFTINIDNLFNKNMITPVGNYKNIVLVNDEFGNSLLLKIRSKKTKDKYVYHLVPIKITNSNYLMLINATEISK